MAVGGYASVRATWRGRSPAAWGEPVLASDAARGRAAALVGELGGEALDNAAVARRADLVVLACKPYQLDAVAPALQGARQGVVSLLGATPIDAAAVRAARRAGRQGDAQHAGRGAPRRDRARRASPDMLDEARALFERVGKVFELPERLMDVATGTVGVSPAYTAVIAEAQIDAGGEVRRAAPSWPPRSSSRRCAGRPSCSPRAATTRSRSAARSPRPAARPRAGCRRSRSAGCARRSARRWRRCWSR